MLELRGITKTYPGVRALDSVSLEFVKGEVHAIAGENWGGEVHAHQGPLRGHSAGCRDGHAGRYGARPDHASRGDSAGISTIYQEFNLVPFLSVAENIFFGREPKWLGFLDKRRMHRMAARLCEDMGVELDTRSRVRDLGVAYQQIVEILKAVSRDARLLIMDEPTAPLTATEIAVLFGIVEKVKRKAVTTIYISHRLEEIFRICDRVSVLRDGRKIVTMETRATTQQELVSFMVGRKLDRSTPPGVHAPGRRCSAWRTFATRSWGAFPSS